MENQARDGSQGPTRASTDSEIRGAVLWIADQLRQIAARIGALCATLPEPCDRFEVQAQLCSALDCVNRDLIQDAIQTLYSAATGDEAELRHDFDQRQQLLAAPRRID